MSKHDHNLKVSYQVHTSSLDAQLLIIFTCTTNFTTVTLVTDTQSNSTSQVLQGKDVTPRKHS